MEAKGAVEAGGAKVWVLEDGVFVTDAGNVLGDTGGRRVRIRGAMHALLVESAGELILLDAGFGPEVPKVLEGRYELQREVSLPEAVKKSGHSPENVGRIILSHLDPDHVGWALYSDAFPNATVYAQKDALEEARTMSEDDGRHLAVEPVERGLKEGWLELLEGDGEIAPLVRVEVRSGHSAGHQIVWIADDLLFTADLAPSKIFLNPDLIAGVDTDPEAARGNRIEVLSEAEKKNALVVLYHEPRDCLVKVHTSKEGFEAEPVDR